MNASLNNKSNNNASSSSTTTNTRNSTSKQAPVLSVTNIQTDATSVPVSITMANNYFGPIRKRKIKFTVFFLLTKYLTEYLNIVNL
jgi:hypothetical protein